MRKSQTKAVDIEQQELLESQRRQNRSNAFDLMKIRDRAWGQLSNGVGMAWHSKKPLEEYEPRRNIPDGFFELTINNESALFDAEEFRKWLRWV